MDYDFEFDTFYFELADFTLDPIPAFEPPALPPMDWVPPTDLPVDDLGNVIPPSPDFIL